MTRFFFRKPYGEEPFCRYFNCILLTQDIESYATSKEHKYCKLRCKYDTAAINLEWVLLKKSVFAFTNICRIFNASHSFGFNKSHKNRLAHFRMLKFATIKQINITSYINIIPGEPKEKIIWIWFAIPSKLRKVQYI